MTEGTVPPSPRPRVFKVTGVGVIVAGAVTDGKIIRGGSTSTREGRNGACEGIITRFKDDERGFDRT